MSIDLDETSKAKLIEQVKKENVERRYWPSDVAVRLEKFYRIPGETRYFIRAVGSYNGHLLIEHSSGDKKPLPVRLGKGTEGYFSKEELESLGILLPE